MENIEFYKKNLLFRRKSLDHDRLNSNYTIMKISRKLAITILRYCSKNPDFYFPFLVMCKEYSPEDDDFVEICPSEWKSIEIDKIYQTFELWENLQDLGEDTTKLLAKGFIEKIT